MPRIRTIKPEIHQDEAIGELSDSAFRLYIGLITQADDAGRLKGHPQLLDATVWPYQPRGQKEVENLLAELDHASLILCYTHAGRPFICLPTWAEHQRVDNAGKSRIPEPNKADGKASPRDSANHRDSPLDQGSRKGSRNRESAAVNRADAPLSYLLADLIESNGSKRPEVGKRWADAERLMLERDGRDYKKTERLLRWCQTDSFWQGNILSFPKFREKYDQLRLQANRDQTKSGDDGRKDMQALARRSA